jgi:NAD(P)-dependent dehydrogenase (short-subunit alcohol dehydrogenase family)
MKSPRVSLCEVTELPIAVVTGGNRGIGLELCRQLSATGWLAVLGSRDLGRGQRAAESLGSPNLRPVQLDVADDASVRSAAEWVKSELGRCDVLINNAAIDYDTDQRASSADLERVHRAMETNLYGAWRMVLAFLPLLRQSPHPRIVNVSSEGGSLASMGGGTPAYHTSKAALNALTLTLAAELRRDGILVNAVCPGWTATDMGEHGGRPVSEGAASVMWAVELPDDGPTGGFFRDGRPLPW